MHYREHLLINKIQRCASLSRNTIKKWLRSSGDALLNITEQISQAIWLRLSPGCYWRWKRMRIVPRKIDTKQRCSKSNIERKLCRWLYDCLRLYPELALSRLWRYYCVCAAQFHRYPA